jgi:hypothetical protein
MIQMKESTILMQILRNQHILGHQFEKPGDFVRWMLIAGNANPLEKNLQLDINVFQKSHKVISKALE